MLKRIAVTDLRVGMFIQEFCGSWMDHPFWKSKFVLNSEKDLARIRDSAISELWIDVSKGADVAAGVQAATERQLLPSVASPRCAAGAAPVGPKGGGGCTVQDRNIYFYFSNIPKPN